MGQHKFNKGAQRFSSWKKMRKSQEKQPVPHIEKPDGKQSVLVAVPTLDGAVRWSIAHQFSRLPYLSNDLAHPFCYNTLMMPGCNPVQYARNKIVSEFLTKGDWDWLYFIDADQEVPDNFWQVMMVSDADIISATTFVWVGSDYERGRLRVNQYSLNDKAEAVNIVPPSHEMPYRAPIVGTGCVAIRRKVFETLGPNPFIFRYGPNGKVECSEDVNFCVAAQKAGFVVAVHPKVVFGHSKIVDLLSVAQWGSARIKAMREGEPEDAHQLRSVSM